MGGGSIGPRGLLSRVTVRSSEFRSTIVQVSPTIVRQEPHCKTKGQAMGLAALLPGSPATGTGGPSMPTLLAALAPAAPSSPSMPNVAGPSSRLHSPTAGAAIFSFNSVNENYRGALSQDSKVRISRIPLGVCLVILIVRVS